MVSTGGYGGNMLGSFLSSRIQMSEENRRWHFYLLFIILLVIALWIEYNKVRN